MSREKKAQEQGLRGAFSVTSSAPKRTCYVQQLDRTVSISNLRTGLFFSLSSRYHFSPSLASPNRPGPDITNERHFEARGIIEDISICWSSCPSYFQQMLVSTSIYTFSSPQFCSAHLPSIFFLSSFFYFYHFLFLLLFCLRSRFLFLFPFIFLTSHILIFSFILFFLVYVYLSYVTGGRNQMYI